MLDRDVIDWLSGAPRGAQQFPTYVWLSIGWGVHPLPGILERLQTWQRRHSGIKAFDWADAVA